MLKHSNGQVTLLWYIRPGGKYRDGKDLYKQTFSERKNTLFHKYLLDFMGIIKNFANNQIPDPLQFPWKQEEFEFPSIFGPVYCIIQSLSFSSIFCPIQFWNCSAELVEGWKKRADEIRSNLNLCWDAMRTLNPCPRTG